MSEILIARVWDTHVETPHDKFVLLALADDAADDGFLGPPDIPHLLRKTRLPKWRLLDALARLEFSGLVSTRYHTADGKSVLVAYLHLQGGGQ